MSALAIALMGVSAADATGQERPPEVPDGVRVAATIAYYDVDAHDLSQAAAVLNRMRLEGADAPPSQGLTEYYMTPEWRMQASAGACRVIEVEVLVEIRITLPRWQGVSGRPMDEQEEWRVIEGAIREHEYGHHDLTVAAAGDLVESMGGLEARSCRTLRDVVASTLSLTGGRLEEAHAELDRATPDRLSIGPRARPPGPGAG